MAILEDQHQNPGVKYIIKCSDALNLIASILEATFNLFNVQYLMTNVTDSNYCAVSLVLGVMRIWE